MVRNWINRKRNPRDHQKLLDMGNWEINLTRWEVQFSDEVYQIYNLSRESYKEQLDIFWEYVHPEDKELVTQFWRQVLQGHRFGRNFTYRIVCNRVRKFVQVNGLHQYDANGNLVQIDGTIRDVTDYSTITQQSKWFDDNSTEAIVVIDKNLGVVRFNSAAEKLFGWTEKELLFRYPPIVPVSYKSYIEGLYPILLKEGGTVWFDTVRVRKDGTEVELSATLSAVWDDHGNVAGAVGIYRNIHEHFDVEEMLFTNEKQLQALVENSSDVFVMLSDQFMIKYVSPAILNVLGYNFNEIVSTSFLDLIHPSDQRGCETNVATVSSGLDHKISADIRLKNKSGEWRICQATFKSLYAFSGFKGLVVNFYDVTEKKQTQERMHYIVEHDYLTDLPNRRAFEQQLSLMIGNASKRHSKLAVMILSLNKFKYVNDTLGHSLGDKLIRVVSRHIRTLLPEECLIARTAGDEFSILVPNFEDKDSVFTLVNQLLSSFDESFEIDKYTVYITAGVGIGFYPTDGSDVNTLMKNTDIAVHRAKEHGHNTVQAYANTLNVVTYKEFSLSNDFRKALYNNEFVLHYQPRIDVSTGKIIAAEALIRWEHKDWGLVSPVEFIGLAEENGFIVPLGDWVLRTVCRQINQWTKLGIPEIKISVNISSKQLLVHGFTFSIQSILKEFNVKPQHIEFEITETSILPNNPAVVESVKLLRKMGIAMYFDDFGTGYSSLSWLHRFELDGIKLDKSFVNHIPHAWAPTQIVSSVINLAHNLKLTVVAEGVETQEQLSFLKNAGCNQIQGYLYSRPLPVGEFESVLRSGVLTPGLQNDNVPQKSQTNENTFVSDLRHP